MQRGDYLLQLQDFLPPGIAWTRDPDAVLTALLDALASEFARIDLRGRQLLDEADPGTTTEMITDWEREVGLPDPCIGALADTLEARRAAVVQRLTARGGASIAYFTAIAAALGYEGLEIDEFRPFIAGISRCGTALNGGHSVRFIWRVRVPGSRLHWFRCGTSAPPDKLLAIDRALDLECIFQRLKPAHTYLVFAYQ
jgi:uncharacterized protein YmfQ (DUF2313 family)